MSVEKEIGVLMLMQTTLTIMLHDLGIECYLAEDVRTAEQLERGA